MKKRFFKKLLIGMTVGFFFVTTFTGVSLAETINWKMASVWIPSLPLFDSDKKFVQIVNEASGGRLNIKLFSAGEIVPAFEVFDAVRSGAIPMGGDTPLYWGGKDLAFAFVGSFPMYMSPVDYWVWLYQAQGVELIQEIYAKYGIVWFPNAVVMPESGFRTNKPINTLADMKGMKLRASGKFQGDLLKSLGVSHVMLSAAEVYQALEKGTVDGTEYSLPSIDWPLGLGEVTKYWLTPAGWHQPSSVTGVLINKKVWDGLPNDLKKFIEYAAMATTSWATTHMEYGCFEATKKFIDKGIKVTRLPDEDLDKVENIAKEILIKECKANPLLAKIARSQIKFLQDNMQWRSIASPFGYGRNSKNLPKLEELQ
ncbi:MAG: TRAP transporter substrate-binding protein DctP [Pseudomonadota bacterium]